MTDVPVEAPEGEQGLFADRTNLGNLGAAVLSRIRTIYDVSHGNLYLASNPEDLKRPFARDRTGLTCERRGDRLIVMHVARNSPAAATGIQEGDEFLAVNGVRVGSPEYARLGSWGRDPAVTHVRLRDSLDREVSLVPRRYY